MPNRILRDTTDSENVNQLSWQAEVFFYRLMMKADDFGCFHGNVKLVKAALFPLRSDSVRDADIVRWIAECEKSGVIAIYGIEGKSYVQIVNFNQRLRSMKSKFPLPSESASSKNGSNLRSNDGDPRSDDSNPPLEVETETKPKQEGEGQILMPGESLDKAQEILNSHSWLENIAMKGGKSLAYCKERLVYFLNRESLKTEFVEKPKEKIMDHFVNWIALQKEQQPGTRKKNQYKL